MNVWKEEQNVNLSTSLHHSTYDWMLENGCTNTFTFIIESFLLPSLSELSEFLSLFHLLSHPLTLSISSQLHHITVYNSVSESVWRPVGHLHHHLMYWVRRSRRWKKKKNRSPSLVHFLPSFPSRRQLRGRSSKWWWKRWMMVEEREREIRWKEEESWRSSELNRRERGMKNLTELIKLPFSHVRTFW